MELSAVTLPLLNVKSNEKDISFKVKSLNTSLVGYDRQLQAMKASLESVESVCVTQFARFNQLDSFCSGGWGEKTGEAIAMHLRNILVRVQRLEQAPTSSSILCSLPLEASSTVAESKLLSLTAELSLVRSSVSDLTSRVGQDAIEIGGVHFQSLSQTIAWVRTSLPSNAYFVFQDIMTLLDLIGTSNLSDNDFLDGQYKANRANFVNASAARCAASFGRGFSTLFGRVEPSSSGGQLASTHPLPSINNYKNFNAPDNLSGVKQRILSKMNTVISRINAEIGQRLAGNIVANTVALFFLLKSQEAVLSLVSWMENFQQELSSAGQSSPKEAWLLVCSCVRGFFQQLEKLEHQLLPLLMMLLFKRVPIFGQWHSHIVFVVSLCLRSGGHTTR